jgi:hypothetical protein
MSQQLDWQCVTVQQFFTQHNWTGKKAPLMVEQKPVFDATTEEVEMHLEFPVDLMKELMTPSPPLEPSVVSQVQMPSAKTEVAVSKPLKQVSWECLTVEDFFRQNNWNGRLQELVFEPVLDRLALERSTSVEPSLSHLPTIAPDRDQLKTTPTVTKTTTKSKKVQPSVFSLTLSVQDFFTMIEWEAPPAIAVLPEIKAKPASSENHDEITLDDLSDLF